MTKLEKLRKEYKSTMLDAVLETGSPEMHKALYDKADRLLKEIQEEKLKMKRGASSEA